MSKDNQIESSSQSYIRLLNERKTVIDGFKPKTRDGALSGELIVAGYLEGTPVRNSDGEIIGSGVCGITVSGRLFLQDLEEKEDAKSVTGRFKKVSGFLLGILVGAFIPVLTELFRSWFIQ